MGVWEGGLEEGQPALKRARCLAEGVKIPSKVVSHKGEPGTGSYEAPPCAGPLRWSTRAHTQTPPPGGQEFRWQGRLVRSKHQMLHIHKPPQTPAQGGKLAQPSAHPHTPQPTQHLLDDGEVVVVGRHAQHEPVLPVERDLARVAAGRTRVKWR